LNVTSDKFRGSGSTNLRGVHQRAALERLCSGDDSVFPFLGIRFEDYLANCLGRITTNFPQEETFGVAKVRID